MTLDGEPSKVVCMASKLTLMGATLASLAQMLHNLERELCNSTCDLPVVALYQTPMAHRISQRVRNKRTVTNTL